MKEVLHALAHNEDITILYHGKAMGIIKPIANQVSQSVKTHPLFGRLKDQSTSVEEIMRSLRGDRYDDI